MQVCWFTPLIFFWKFYKSFQNRFTPQILSVQGQTQIKNNFNLVNQWHSLRQSDIVDYRAAYFAAKNKYSWHLKSVTQWWCNNIYLMWFCTSGDVYLLIPGERSRSSGFLSESCCWCHAAEPGNTWHLTRDHVLHSVCKENR